MFTQLIIKNFRCFDMLELDNLKLITLIGGRNNTGKSAILESLFLAVGYKNPNIFLALAAGRNGNGILQPTPQRIWNPLFYMFEKNAQFDLMLLRDTGIASTLTMRKISDESVDLDVNTDTVTNILKQGYNPSSLGSYFFSLQYEYTLDGQKSIGKFSFEDKKIKYISLSVPKKEAQLPIVKAIFYKSIYIPDNTTIAEWISRLILDGEKDLILYVLTSFDSRIKDITTIVENAVPYVYVILHDGQKMPITYMGDGINKILQLLLCILTTPKGVVLIDELENGFHYSTYAKVLRVLYQTALQKQCQLFITTHNVDILRESANVMRKLEQLDSVCYQRIDFSQGKRHAYSFSGEELESALDIQLEVR
ncbi:AAA family ATPase [Megasphaera butyrica]|uniref:AAA family ATPase n=1 Tax=Megasphaera butyrica TaxID=2981791 RepID=UPI0008219BC4|nr:ATP-binding protein [Megasphaera butyrica]MCU6715447.1 AAA family ATPase [Megasphaera butyrica]SCI09001.1 Uncharacterized conserved protein [uncultured Megasphaera sp.]SCJ62015.1 Uncharacterized conserved protein [uncultured Ruminococcus sp.]